VNIKAIPDCRIDLEPAQLWLWYCWFCFAGPCFGSHSVAIVDAKTLTIFVPIVDANWEVMIPVDVPRREGQFIIVRIVAEENSKHSRVIVTTETLCAVASGLIHRTALFR
jgi:hypothetical protein